MISKEQFTEATGYPPKDDDLERVNCRKAGDLGHFSCGWCCKHNKPMFECFTCVQIRVLKANESA